MPPIKKEAKKSQKNTSSTPDTIVTKIVAEFKDRQRAEIKKWRNALTMATHPETPRLYPLQDLCDNLKADGHFIGDMRVRKAATLCTPFSIIDRVSGDVQQEKTDLFNRKWFYDFMKSALDYVARGYTLMELIDPIAPKFKVIPRRNIAPSQHLVLLEVGADKGIDYRTEIGRTLIEIGEEDDLGLMADLCGQLIWKRNAQQSWAEFSERFGFPLITATTNKSSATDIANIRKMLAALGEASQAVLPDGTTIDIKEAGTGDSYQVYDKQIDRINRELSKAVLSGTMVTDDGSSRSQSEVHERTLDDKIAEDDRRVITFTVNDQIIPMLAMWGHDLNPETDQFRFEPSDELTLDKRWEIVRDILDRYDVPPEWVSREFGTPIDAKKRITESALKVGGISANFR